MNTPMEFFCHFGTGPITPEALLLAFLILLGATGVTATLIAYYAAAFIGMCVASFIEGLSIICLVMSVGFKRLEHWFWRPFVWTFGCLLITVLALIANGRLFTAFMPADEGELIGWSLLWLWLPSLLSAPFTLFLLVFAAIAVVKGTIRLVKKIRDKEVEFGPFLKATLGWFSVLTGEALLFVSLLVLAVAPLAFLVAETSWQEMLIQTGFSLVFSTIVAIPALALLWVGRTQGALRTQLKT